MKEERGTSRDGIVFEWDPGKAKENFTKHGVTFDQAADAFLDEFGVTFLDIVDEHGEERFHLIAATQGVILLLVVYTFRDRYGEDRIRIISARKATPRERQLYDYEVA